MALFTKLSKKNSGQLNNCCLVLFFTIFNDDQWCRITESIRSAFRYLFSGMLILVLVLVLKDSLRTFLKSLSLSWSLGVRSLSLSLSLGGQVQEVLVLVLVLGGQ